MIDKTNYYDNQKKYQDFSPWNFVHKDKRIDQQEDVRDIPFTSSWDIRKTQNERKNSPIIYWVEPEIELNFSQTGSLEFLGEE